MNLEEFQDVSIRIADIGDGMMRVYADFSRGNINELEMVNMTPAERTCMRFLGELGLDTSDVRKYRLE